jgi:hypothetical protein
MEKVIGNNSFYVIDDHSQSIKYCIYVFVNMFVYRLRIMRDPEFSSIFQFRTAAQLRAKYNNSFAKVDQPSNGDDKRAVSQTTSPTSQSADLIKAAVRLDQLD